MHLKVQFKHPFCSHCIQLTVQALISQCPLVKFAEDTELVGKISNDEYALHHKQTENFVNWCDKKYFLNVSKMKEMCTDFSKNQRCLKTVYIKWEDI